MVSRFKFLSRIFSSNYQQLAVEQDDEDSNDDHFNLSENGPSNFQNNRRYKRNEIETSQCTKHVVVALVAMLFSFLALQTFSKMDIKAKFRGAVAANGPECAEIGKKILEQGGSAVDAAIATLFCDGVTNPQSAGLGGGMLMLVYTKQTRRVSVINAQEMAPAAAHQYMFVENPSASHTGGLSIGVPGELKGYWEAYQEYGRLPWHKLVEPSADLAKKGHIVTPYLANVFKKEEANILAEPTLSGTFINPKTGQTWKEGDIVKIPALAKTLETIATEGVDALYSKEGSVLNDLLIDLRSFGSIITEEDILNYKVQWTEPVVNQLDEDHQLFSMPLPGSGILLSFIMNLMKGYDKADGSILSIHRMIEAFKFAYVERGYLGDPYFVQGIEERITNLSSEAFANYIRTKINDERTYEDYEYYGANFSVPEDHGTVHISVLTPDGDAVAVTSTINLLFGSKLRSPKTGIILNDEMENFATPGTSNELGVPPSPTNYIAPGKQPMSSMSPTIIIDTTGQPVMVVGASGGTKITTAVTTVILNHLYMGKSITEAIAAPRVHHQLAPMYVEYDDDSSDMNSEVKSFWRNFELSKLKYFQHKMRRLMRNSIQASVVGVTCRSGVVEAAFDPRHGGSIGYLV